jgi:hypothetical protein
MCPLEAHTPRDSKAIGFDERFDEGREFLNYIAKHDQSKTRWDNLETGAFEFWYRGCIRKEVGRLQRLWIVSTGVSEWPTPWRISARVRHRTPALNSMVCAP